MTARVLRRASIACVTFLLGGCLVKATGQEQRSIDVEAGAPCPGRDHPSLHVPRFSTEGNDGEVVSVDEGPVEGSITESARADGSVYRFRRCFYLVTIETSIGAWD